MNQREEINGTSSKGEEMTLTWKQRGMSIIVSNVPETLFDDYDVKAEFEALFESCGDKATFYYLKHMSRVRIDYTKADSVSWALQTFKGQRFYNLPLRVQRTRLVMGGKSHLMPPTPQKQFLISPPVSPPFDWEHSRENAPVASMVNYDLLTAVAGLSDKPFELHSSSDIGHPSIMVIAPQDKDDNEQQEFMNTDPLRVAIAGSNIHTKRPPMPQ